ncbi:hypothetical protein [Dyella choica]|uniref:Uncharacterized protein n=1 Tax=Dyella choica TaxID=1927959 RepID=A0A3S0RLL8_9GAMM|nr:hypothetical protein [Dyella choica]RUL77530.1 hypothetical protein EKH80_06485 [Dyella choica]
MSEDARALTPLPTPTTDTSAPVDPAGARAPAEAAEERADPSFSQLEKLLMMVAFDPAFAERLIAYGETAKTRYAFEFEEGALLDQLMSHHGAGMRAMQNVLRATIDTCECLARENAKLGGPIRRGV